MKRGGLVRTVDLVAFGELLVKPAQGAHRDVPDLIATLLFPATRVHSW